MFRPTHKEIDLRFADVARRDGWTSAVQGLKKVAQKMLDSRPGVKGVLSPDNYFKAVDVDAINMLDARALMSEWRKVIP
jgi:hypothetical protein